jgi:GDP/UDP-N,N'-diacetylbacillosamine 2-epimerase (hydrolysing)
MRRICIITGTRAEYGLLFWVIKSIHESPEFELQLIVTGTHLSPEFGSTISEIEQDGIPIARRIEMLLSSDTKVGTTKSLGLGLIGFADAFSELNPHLLLLLGDRYEIFAAAAAAMIGTIPIAHLHGGELTEGAIDDSIRHAITKMSHIHFVAAEKYRRRVIQLGEDPNNVHVVGGLGIENILKLKLLSRQELEENLCITFSKKNFLVTFHPVTLDEENNQHQVYELLEALNSFPDATLIFTMPNADTNGRKLSKLINEYVSKRSNAYFFKSLGQLRYLSCISLVDAVVGNSSSGLIEVPAFRKATINIGDRQKGRICAESVISCEPDRIAIREALDFSFCTAFQAVLLSSENPYDLGNASDKITRILLSYDFKSLLKKKFFES